MGQKTRQEQIAAFFHDHEEEVLLERLHYHRERTWEAKREE